MEARNNYTTAAADYLHNQRPSGAGGIGEGGFAVPCLSQPMDLNG